MEPPTPAPPAEPTAPPPRTDPLPSPDPPGPRREETLDESNGARGGPPAEPSDDVCGPCFVIGGAVAILIAAIPLAAEADGAGRSQDSLRQWIKDQGTPASELGFIVGYGFARQSQRQERFTIAAALTGGIGGAALIAGVIWLAADGRIPGIGEGPRKIRVGHDLTLEPYVPGSTVGATLRF